MPTLDIQLIGAVSQYGKSGMVCIAKTMEEAKEFYDNTIAVPDKESCN